MTLLDTAPRLSIREPISTDGFVDAAWWPHSLELSTEIEPLLVELANRGRNISRVIYNLDHWHNETRRLMLGDHPVRFGGFREQDPLLVSLIESGGTRKRIDVLLIDPSTEPGVAAKALELAGTAGDLLRPAEIMAAAQS
ncbi:DUF5994 family protein [Jatrophihabitans sp.]|uniref:DUF5994 family protein n=1 Tax=Jatrophihabitans sp. TaxID=1932789 RepID=UPI0030C771D8|nr:hypothetical protein [Jatrophihabitans sp.]